jgi:hypothetical protein
MREIIIFVQLLSNHRTDACKPGLGSTTERSNNYRKTALVSCEIREPYCTNVTSVGEHIAGRQQQPHCTTYSTIRKRQRFVVII